MLKYQGSWRRTQIMKNSSNRNSNDERESEKLRCRIRRSLNDGQESERVDDGLREFERRVCIRASQTLRFDKMVSRGHQGPRWQSQERRPDPKDIEPLTG